jgi:hypothetical protein
LDTVRVDRADRDDVELGVVDYDYVEYIGADAYYECRVCREKLYIAGTWNEYAAKVTNHTDSHHG